MKPFVAVLLLACAVTGQNLNVGTLRQYQSASGDGQASFGYSHPGQASVTHRDSRGNQMGSYAYIDPDGNEVRVSYIADEQGYRIVSNDQVPLTNASPVPAVISGNYLAETPEVAAARAEHLAALARAGGAIHPNSWSPAPVQQTWSAPVVQQTWSQQRWDQPAPMGDTPEVANAKLEFFRAYNAAAKAAAENPDPEPPRQTWSAPVVQTQTWSAPAPVVQRLDLPTTDTPEVIAAKQRFFEAYNIAARAAALNPERK